MSGEKRLVGTAICRRDGELDHAALSLLARGGQRHRRRRATDDVFVESYAPRPEMYVFGASDHVTALVTMGKFLGYRVTVCDARAKFVTEERFPDADELVVEWPDRFLETAPVDARTAICMLTHDMKFDVPALQKALATNAGYIGAIGTREDSHRARAKLRDAGVRTRISPACTRPIGVQIGARDAGGGRGRDRGRDHLGVQREDAARLAGQGLAAGCTVMILTAKSKPGKDAWSVRIRRIWTPPALRPRTRPGAAAADRARLLSSVGGPKPRRRPREARELV